MCNKNDDNCFEELVKNLKEIGFTETDKKVTISVVQRESTSEEDAQ